jgi:uncharacterized protein (TIGR03067 family)
MTRAFALVVVIAAWSSAAALAWETPAKTDSLEGTWALVSVEINAQPLSMEKLQNARLVVHGPKYSVALGDVHLEMTHVLKKEGNPKQMDLTIAEGADKGKTFPAIYKLDGNTLTVCRNIAPAKERPTAFATKADTGLMLVVWKRQNAVSKDPAP